MKNRHPITEGHSIFRPPFFDGTNYAFWKMRMKIFVQSMNAHVWRIIEQGPRPVPKLDSEWSDADLNNFELNSRAIHYLLCAVDAHVFKKLSRCASAKEMWEKLQGMYEESDQVRKVRIDALIPEYESFKMEEDEGIEEMFRRFEKIVYDLDFLGQCYSDEDLVWKVLRSVCVTSPCKDKIAAMEASGKIYTIRFDELRSNLIAYEKYCVMRERSRGRKIRGGSRKLQN